MTKVEGGNCMLGSHPIFKLNWLPNKACPYAQNASGILLEPHSRAKWEYLKGFSCMLCITAFCECWASSLSLSLQLASHDLSWGPEGQGYLFSGWDQGWTTQTKSSKLAFGNCWKCFLSWRWATLGWMSQVWSFDQPLDIYLVGRLN